ncbi:MAG: A/G-specific adenine glycosylase [Chloroflexota bacterium]|nr:A/G-specific adenine glycosylase [Chloroflexota bacterium]
MRNHPATSLQPPQKIADVRERLLTWWHANRRDLPWRQTRDPYRILVSEVMLQQTQVDRVIPYYHEWLERFPNVEALAAAPTADVIRLWAGLGYNRRAVNLQRTAQAVVEHGGAFPEDVESLKTLPGIGPYTAGAIACFAFEQDVAFIDTNMRRVLHRVFLGPEIPVPLATDREITAIAAEAIPPTDGWNWNQGLIEFGALQCTARKPLCVICPLQQVCCAWPDMQTAIAQRPKTATKATDVPFRESNRFFRGRVVDALRDDARGELSLAELGPLVRPGFVDADMPWMIEVVRGLERDGLARIAEDASAYRTDLLEREADQVSSDTVTSVDAGTIIVRLP